MESSANREQPRINRPEWMIVAPRSVPRFVVSGQGHQRALHIAAIVQPACLFQSRNANPARAGLETKRVRAFPASPNAGRPSLRASHRGLESPIAPRMSPAADGTWSAGGRHSTHLRVVAATASCREQPGRHRLCGSRVGADHEAPRDGAAGGRRAPRKRSRSPRSVGPLDLEHRSRHAPQPALTALALPDHASTLAPRRPGAVPTASGAGRRRLVRVAPVAGGRGGRERRRAVGQIAIEVVRR